MDDFDLDIDNYDLEDILRLFKLDYSFNKENMKQAKLRASKKGKEATNAVLEIFKVV